MRRRGRLRAERRGRSLPLGGGQKLHFAAGTVTKRPVLGL